MTAVGFLKALGRGVEVVVAWTLKLFVAFLAVTIPMAVAFEGGCHWWAAVVPFSALALSTCFIPKRTERLCRWAGRQLSKPYNLYFVPYVAEPIERAAEWAEPVLESLIVGAFRIALVILGIALVLAVGIVLIAGVAALPVSIAVIIGALIIAGAVRARR